MRLYLLGKVNSINHIFKFWYKIGVFEDDDFKTDDCEEINSIILEEAFSFVTFMQQMIGEMIGKEDFMKTYLDKASLGLGKLNG